ncbi:MAG: extracellular solute-binding protein, partial [Lachnospiraceae bacterium]|nr:extracellular solute-binding protein [Lachnospiraceae bacterium]
MRKKYLAYLLAAAMTLSLAGCGGASKENDSKTQEENTPQQNEDSGDSQEAEDNSGPADEGAEASGSDTGLSGSFSIYHMHGEDDTTGTAAAFWKAADKFMEENPNVNIEFVFSAHDGYQQKLTAMMAGDELTDVWLTKGDMLPSFADTGTIQAADQYIKQDSEWANAYLDGAFGDCTYNGTEWGIPMQMQANTIGIYNKAIFEECGIDKWPETWTELLEDCEKIKAKGYIPIAMGNKEQWVAESTVFNTYAYKYVDQEWF